MTFEEWLAYRDRMVPGHAPVVWDPGQMMADTRAADVAA
jgi:hypothetical protein